MQLNGLFYLGYDVNSCVHVKWHTHGGGDSQPRLHNRLIWSGFKITYRKKKKERLNFACQDLLPWFTKGYEHLKIWSNGKYGKFIEASGHSSMTYQTKW